MSGLERPVAQTVWELRGAWAQARIVRLMLAQPPCVIGKVIGHIARVSVTGAFVVCDGWHVPCETILSVGSPPLEEVEAYRAARAEERRRMMGVQMAVEV